MSRPVAEVVIVTWNGRDDTLRALDATLAQTGNGRGQVPDVRVTVVDNGSTDGTRDEVVRRGERVRLICLAENRGFTGGVAAATEASDAEHFVFLNNDALPESGWLESLVGAMASAPADVAAVAGRIIDYEGQRADFVDGAMTFDGHAFQPGFRKPLGTISERPPGAEMLFACGGNMVVRRDAWHALGGFDDDFFAYLEDVDFGWRVWLTGRRVLWEPGATVRHRSSATSDRLGSFERGVLFERNALQTVFKNYDDEHLRTMAGPILLTLLHRTLRYTTDRNPGSDALRRAPFGESNHRAGTSLSIIARLLAKFGYHKGPVITDPLTTMQFRALHWFFANRDSLARKRAAVQAMRTRGDDEILAKFGPLLVPTYHGDTDLFGSELFAMLTNGLDLRKATLEELMNR
ncbi:MAG: glycosyltransferase family 2 protein [Acidobacteria bacterium]|nr:glycosyltransferase family 2 protein [Acidobacteriota bacterium]